MAQFARESLASLVKAQAKTVEAAEQKRPDAKIFNREYDLLFKSAGRRGDKNALWLASTAADEPKLKRLRERILQRDSDEAFDDYQQINATILRNRWIRSMPPQKAAGPHESKAAESFPGTVPAGAGRLAFDAYSGYFVSNRFEPDAADSFVAIADQKRFDEVFGVARVMDDQSHHLPENVFASSLIVAAVKRGKAVWEFQVEERNGPRRRRGASLRRYGDEERHRQFRLSADRVDSQGRLQGDSIHRERQGGGEDRDGGSMSVPSLRG